MTDLKDKIKVVVDSSDGHYTMRLAQGHSWENTVEVERGFWLDYRIFMNSYSQWQSKLSALDNEVEREYEVNS